MRQLVETLRCCGHQAFPITPDVRKAYDSAEPFDLHGIMLRSTLLRLIQHRIGFFSPEASGEIPSARAQVPTTQAVRHYTRGLRIPLTIMRPPQAWQHECIASQPAPGTLCCSLTTNGALEHCNILPPFTRCAMLDSDQGPNSCGMQERLSLLERLEQRPLKVRREEQDALLRGLSSADLDLLLDMRPFMQRNPCMVHSDASLSRAYRLFRTMGLRHLFVCQPQPKVHFSDCRSNPRFRVQTKATMQPIYFPALVFHIMCIAAFWHLSDRPVHCNHHHVEADGRPSL